MLAWPWVFIFSETLPLSALVCEFLHLPSFWGCDCLHTLHSHRAGAVSSPREKVTPWSSVAFFHVCAESPHLISLSWNLPSRHRGCDSACWSWQCPACRLLGSDARALHLGLNPDLRSGVWEDSLGGTSKPQYSLWWRGPSWPFKPESLLPGLDLCTPTLN